MREIQFRVWNKSEKRFSFQRYPRPFINYREDGDALLSFALDSKCIFGGFAVSQNTGIEDIDGKPIFEGDIVRVNDGNRVVEWRGSGFYCSWSEYGLDTVWFGGGAPKVIGNIFENPELAKQIK